MSEIELQSAMMLAALTLLNKKRKNLSPDELAKREEQAAIRAEALYDAQYRQAHIDHEEYKRSPRAFMRRLTLSKVEGSK